MEDRFVSRLDPRLEPTGAVRRFEVIDGAAGRRRWSADDRARILEETLVPGAVVSVVARRHGLTPQQVFTWRREARQARAALPTFVPGGDRFRARGGGARPDEAGPPARQAISLTSPRGGDRGGGGRRHCADRRRRLARHHRSGDRRAEGQPVIGPTGAVRVMVATAPVDFRKVAEGLAALVRESLGGDPFSGTVYVFRAQRANRIKLVCFDGTGMCLLSKRLEDGRFCWPAVTDGVVRLTAAQLQPLLVPAWHSRAHPLRQWSRDDLEGVAQVDCK